MSIKPFAKRLFVALFLVMVALVFQTASVHHANAGPAPFLITPYFGTKGINSWFDHQYPTYTSYPNTLYPNVVIYTGDSRPTCSYPNQPGTYCYNGHDGIDFNVVYTDVVAAADGTVTLARWSVQDCHDGPNCGFGLSIEIVHHNGYFTRYGHLSAIAVAEGDSVIAGQVIGTSGNTGNSSGPHLHFGLFDQNLRSLDPFGWSSTGTDPWQNYSGATSYCLWKDGEWANICGGTSRPIPEPNYGGTTFVNVTTDNTGGFSKGNGGPFNNACIGNCANWTYYNNEMYWTLVNGSTPNSWAKWQAAVSPNGGIYEVFVYVTAGNNATTWQAPYTVRYSNNTLQTTALIDEYGLGNQWVSIGTYYMTNNDYVFATDATGEANGPHCLSLSPPKLIVM